ncbi:unnamed protein product [Mytilus edulis]|uniref:Integrase catalytic domain-containing protein n=1 Tax=Mytilus edulis TaxID=6550 RepID=A0A8S3VGV5_MYTED|nr:unnamed protein product [Mytilus edulis]
MDLNGVPQPQMNWDSTNLVDTWKKFKQHVGLILDGPLAEKDEKVKITYLLLWVGEKGRDIYNTWQLSEDDAKKLSVHFDKFLTYVQPKQNSLLARCKFRYETQSSDTVEQFITRLKLIAKDCNFKDTDEMIRDTNSPPILGMQSCLDYELIKLVYSTETTCTSDSDPMTKSSVLKDYSDIFKGVGLVSGKATIHIDSEVPPVVHPPRRVPVALRGRLNLPISDRKIEEIEKATLSDPQFDILKSVILEEVHKLHGTTSTTVINKLKGTFSRLGIPETVVSDNGPQYSSQEFSEFANKWDFKHVTSSPHYPQSNGLAEKTVQTVKNMFNKCKKDGKDPYVALLEYRTTPLDIGYTPSQLLMCRKLRSVLPTTLEELVPKTPIYNEVQNKIDCKKSYKKKYYDKGSKPLKSLNSGDSVRIRGSNGLWKPAIISSQHPASRSYIVESQDGGIYRRNRRHIIGTREEVPLTTVENDTIVPPVRYEPQCNLTPPELAEPTSNINNSPQITSDTETTETQQIPSDGLYITRSGRIVKPKIIESM